MPVTHWRSEYILLDTRYFYEEQPACYCRYVLYEWWKIVGNDTVLSTIWYFCWKQWVQVPSTFISCSHSVILKCCHKNVWEIIIAEDSWGLWKPPIEWNLCRASNIVFSEKSLSEAVHACNYRKGANDTGEDRREHNLQEHFLKETTSLSFQFLHPVSSAFRMIWAGIERKPPSAVGGEECSCFSPFVSRLIKVHLVTVASFERSQEDLGTGRTN